MVRNWFGLCFHDSLSKEGSKPVETRRGGCVVPVSEDAARLSERSEWP